MEEVTHPKPSTQNRVRNEKNRAFLKRYRAAGLPGAKKSRRATRLALAEMAHTTQCNMLLHAIRTIALQNRALAKLRDETNWAVKNETELMWVGEEDPIDIIDRVAKTKLAEKGKAQIV